MGTQVSLAEDADQLLSAASFDRTRFSRDNLSVSKLGQSLSEKDTREIFQNMAKSEFEENSINNNLKGSHFQIKNRMLGNLVDIEEHNMIGKFIRKRNTAPK